MYLLTNVIGVPVVAGVGLFFSFHAPANGHSETPDLALTARALASGIVALGVQAVFGTPGGREDEPGVFPS